jgi:hypothetical protein
MGANFVYYSLSVIFRPGMHPADRGYFDDELEEALEKAGLGEIVGGGTAMDGSFCDIGIAVTNLEAALQLIREVLRRCDAPTSTVIVSGESKEDRREYRVYE